MQRGCGKVVKVLQKSPNLLVVDGIELGRMASDKSSYGKGRGKGPPRK